MNHENYMRLLADPIRHARHIERENEYRFRRYHIDLAYKRHRNAKAREHYEKNRDKIIKQVSERYTKKKGEILKQKYHSQYQKGNKLREQIIAYFGSKCIRCGFSDKRALQVDHLNGGGREEHKVISNRVKFYRNVLANLEKYQLLCANCNWIKRAENKEYRGSKYENMPKV